MRSRPLAIVCDSTASLTREEAARLGVTLVPMGYTVDGVGYDEGYMGENGDYDRLFRQARIVSTEAVYPGAFVEAFGRLVGEGADVLAITISGRLSGTFRSARAAAAEANGRLTFVGVEGPRVVALDSWTTVAGIEFLVRRARELADRGDSLDRIVSDLEAARAAQGICFTVPDIAVLRRSGRLGATRLAVAGKLDRYLVMDLHEGGIRDVAVAHGARALGRGMAAQVPAGARDLVVTHYGARGIGAKEVFRAAKTRFPDASVRVKDGGPVVSRHLGLGSVSLGWAAPGA